jgi:hypothetical protein
VSGAPRALPGQTVEMWRLDDRMPRARQGVAAQLVEGDEQDVQ